MQLIRACDACHLPFSLQGESGIGMLRCVCCGFARPVSGGEMKEAREYLVRRPKRGNPWAR